MNGHTCEADKDCEKDNCITALFKPGTFNITWGADEPESKICCDRDNLLSADMKCKETAADVAKWTGSSNKDVWALATDDGWYDCDNANANCANICPVKIRSGENITFGEYPIPIRDSSPIIDLALCCGDDPSEHKKNGTQSMLPDGEAKCCNSIKDCVDAEGNCVPGGTIIGNKICAECGWTSTFNWDGTAGGCCPDDNQCVVDEDGNSSYNNQPEEWYKGNTPICIRQGQYLLDHLCGADGQWLSRTSRVAGAMISNQLDDYIIACDNYTNNLNYYGYNLNEWVNQFHYLWETGNCTPFSCFNKFCVARDKEGEIKAVGGSINPDKGGGKAYEKAYMVLNVTGAHCSDDSTRNEFISCGKGLVFNPHLNAFVYTKRETGFFQTIINFFTSLANKIINPIARLFTGYQAANPSDPIGYLYNYRSPNLDVLYVADVDDKYVIGMMDRFNRTDRMLINYTGITEGDLCLMIENSGWGNKINCTKTATGFSLYGKSRIGSANVLRDAWVELTYKLRFN